MSDVSQRFSRISNAEGPTPRENNAVSSGGAICARGLPSRFDLYRCKPLTCSDTALSGKNDGVRGLLRLRECSHHVRSSGIGSPRSVNGCPKGWAIETADDRLTLRPGRAGGGG